MAKTYYTVPDKSGGDTFTEAMWDQSIKTNINNVLKPADCQLALTSQGLTQTTPALVSWSSESKDSDSMWSSGDPTVLNINTEGWWLISAHLNMNAVVTFTTHFLQNATDVIGAQYGRTWGTVTSLVYLGTSDEVTCTAEALSNGATATGWLTATWLSQS